MNYLLMTIILLLSLVTMLYFFFSVILFQMQPRSASCRGASQRLSVIHPVFTSHSSRTQSIGAGVGAGCVPVTLVEV